MLRKVLQMSDHWLSETSMADAKTAIFLGPVSEDVLHTECKKYPKGVLWITSSETDGGASPPNLKVIQSSSDRETTREAVQEIFLFLLGTVPDCLH